MVKAEGWVGGGGRERRGAGAGGGCRGVMCHF